jgi:alcohol dehydrogenase
MLNGTTIFVASLGYVCFLFAGAWWGDHGRLVSCGATSGPTATINLMQLFQQQYRIVGSFGASIRNVGDGLQKMAIGLEPTVEAEIPIEKFGAGLERLRNRDVFGKLVVRIAS